MERRRNTPVSARANAAVIGALAAVAFLAAGCRSTTNTGAPRAEPSTTVAFGDPSTFGLQLTSFDREKEIAKVSLRAPAELVVLAVIPGRDIELIVPSDVPKNSRASFAKGVSSIDLARWAVSAATANSHDATQQALTRSRCIQQAEAAAKQAAAQRKVKIDTTGKYVDDGRGAADIDAIAARMQRDCDKPESDKSDRVATPVRMPPRAVAERYLVVFASSTPLTPAQVEQRIGALAVAGSDVVSTLEAIAAGLYAGTAGTWGGTYVAW